MRKAKVLAVANVRALADLVSEDTPLIGIEPSAVLTLRDEYLDLVDDVDLEKASRLARHTMLFEEYLAKEMDRGAIGHEQFTDEANCVLFHAHCHQKALASVEATRRVLSLPRRYRVEEIPSGCCGMAGNFGYEYEHYELSMQIGELVLFPAIRKEPKTTLIVANGTSCRTQILDGTGRRALHPAEVLWAALHK